MAGLKELLIEEDIECAADRLAQLPDALAALLNRVGIDPAILTSPVLTSLTEMAAFFVVLAIAAAALNLG